MAGRPGLVARGATLAERLAALTDRSGGPDACWPWLRAKDKDGYGKMQIGGRTARPHRLALELALGRVVGGLVLHSCDNPPCCNPAHLSEGTQLQNRRDAVARGRVARGDRSGARLYPERMPRGERHHRSRVSDLVRGAIAWMRSIGMCPGDVVRATGAPLTVVYGMRAANPDRRARVARLSASSPATADSSADAAGRSTVDRRDRPRRSGARTGAAREPDAPYASDVTGGLSLAEVGA